MVAFARDLRDFGWHVDVLTISANALPDLAAERIQDIPQATRIIRAFGFDAARQLTVLGRYPLCWSLPDRWSTWRLGGVVSGLRHIRRWRPDALMSSFPVATAHLIARDLQRFTNLPWLADFRDPMAQDDYPKEPRVWASVRRLEGEVVDRAAAMTFTTPGAIAYYLQRYGTQIAPRCHLIANGFDENTFADAERNALESSLVGALTHGPLTLIHSGLLYPWERDPLPFFDAVKALADRGFWHRHPVRFVFRGSGFDEHYATVIEQRGIAHLIHFRERLAYRSALREMLRRHVKIS